MVVVCSDSIFRKYAQIIFGVIFILLPPDIFAGSNSLNVKSLDNILVDDYLPSETRFNYQSICSGDNRVVELQGRNYIANDGRGRVEILRMQTNDKVVIASDIESINKRIYDPSGSKFFSTLVKCNKHEVIIFVNYRKFIDKKSRNNTLEIKVRNDGSIKIDEY